MPEAPASTTGPADHAADPGAARRVRVLLPVPFPGALDYRVPDEMEIPAPGSFVAVTLGRARLVGVVWEGDDDDTVPPERLKSLDDVLPTPRLPAELRRFVERVAGYTLAPPGAVLRMSMSVGEALLPPPSRRICAITGEGMAALDDPPKTLTAARRRALRALREGAASVAEVARRAGVGAAVIRGLFGLGWAEERVVPGVVKAPVEPDWRAPGPILSPDQEKAARVLVDAVEGGGFRVTLLDGVTGSGKTETYFAAIAAALAQGRQVLVLLPEIALGAQWLERFRRRFGTAPVEWHSDIPAAAAARRVAGDRQRAARRSWSARARRCSCRCRTGLIVVDEEHDHSYKQEDGVCYQARDMAVLRALAGADPGRAGVGDAVAGDRRQCLARPLSPGRPAATPCRGGACRTVTLIDMRPRQLRAGAVSVAAAGRGARRDAGGRRAVAALPQSPGLCAAGVVPRLRASLPVPELLGVAGRAPA